MVVSAGYMYMSVHAIDPPQQLLDLLEHGQEEEQKEAKQCLEKPALGFDHDRCTHRVKYAPFAIPVQAFERSLIIALQAIGVNALPRNFTWN